MWGIVVGLVMVAEAAEPVRRVEARVFEALQPRLRPVAWCRQHGGGDASCRTVDLPEVWIDVNLFSETYVLHQPGDFCANEGRVTVRRGRLSFDAPRGVTCAVLHPDTEDLQPPDGHGPCVELGPWWEATRLESVEGQVRLYDDDGGLRLILESVDLVRAKEL